MPSPDLVTLFVAPLNRLGVTYMVTGSLAAGMYGEARLTNDIDLVLVLVGSDVARLHAAFDTPDFYVPPAEVIEIERRRPLHGHVNLIHHDTAFKADVYFAGADPLHQWALAQRRQVTIDGEVVWVAPPEYVIARKLQYFRDGGSEKHLSDIRAMLRTPGSGVDMAAVQAAVERAGVREVWDTVRSV